MEQTNGVQRSEEGAGEDAVIRRAVAYLCRNVGGFRQRPINERVAFLKDLGLSPTAASEVVDTYARLFEDSPYTPPDQETVPVRCPIPWLPSVLTPVFYGQQDFDVFKDPPAQGVLAAGLPGASDEVFDPTHGAPVRLRIFYPTIEGSVTNAGILQPCGRYPLVVFLHGQCGPIGQDYRQWRYLPQVLAHSGYVVVVPDLGTFGFSDSTPGATRIEKVLAWMRQRWPQREYLAPSPATAIVGHSYGALLGGQLAVRLPVAAFVSLSGDWHEFPNAPVQLSAFNLPVLFAWGTGVGGIRDALEPALFDLVPAPKHKIEFEGAGHYDYFPRPKVLCPGQGDPGPCGLVEQLAGDLTALFLSRYLPPFGRALPIPASLRPEPIDLTVQQEFYTGGHLVGLKQIGADPQCSVTHSWVSEAGDSGSVTLSGT